MSETRKTIRLDGTEYTWVHHGCFCLGHCGIDNLLVDGEPYGAVDNPALCGLICDLIDRVHELEKTDE